MKNFLLLAITLLIHSFYAHAQGDPDFEYTKTEVMGAISMLSGAGGNIAVLEGEQGLLIIDDGFAHNGGKLEQALAEFGAAPRYVLNTHWHGDHTGGNATLGEATILAHENVRVRLAKGAKFGNRVIEPAPESAMPDITYQDGTTIYFAGQTVSAVHFPPGHTDGDTVVFLQPANVVHMGDHMFAGRFPFIDTNSGGSVQGYIKNVATVIDKIDQETIVIPGHGKITNRDGLKDFHAMLLETTKTIAEMKSAGKTLEQAQATGLDKKWSDWGTGFINQNRWISIVWNDL